MATATSLQAELTNSMMTASSPPSEPTISSVSISSSSSPPADPMLPSITHATRKDIPEILAMICELADYEHALDKVHATEASLLATLSFADSSSPSSIPSGPGYAKALILRAPASVVPGSFPDTAALEVAGLALYFNNYSTWRSAPGVYLEDLYVRPLFRKRGYGKLLIQTLAGECRRIGGSRLEWCCLRWNEPSLKFYRSLGAVEMQDWVTLRVDGETLEKMADDAGKGTSGVTGVAA